VCSADPKRSATSSQGIRGYMHIMDNVKVTTNNCGCGPGSSVGIEHELRAGRSGIESRWGRDFLPVQTGPGAHSASCKMGTGSFPGVKCGQGVLLTTHPLLVPRSCKSRAIPLPTLWATHTHTHTHTRNKNSREQKDNHFHCKY